MALTFTLRFANTVYYTAVAFASATADVGDVTKNKNKGASREEK